MVDMKSLGHVDNFIADILFNDVKCSLEPTDQFIDNPTDTKQNMAGQCLDALTLHKRPSFFVGSRYGRSGSSSASGSSLFATSKTRRLNVVPRNDRFFLSSRYGKRAGMDFSNNNNNRKTYENQNKNDYDYYDNSITIPLLSTPYEQALISEISTGTQLSSKPIPSTQQQQFNDGLPSSLSSSSSSASSLQPYAYMSCVYTGLQNYYRCNSINPMYYSKNAAINDDDKERMLNDVNRTAFLNDDNDDDNDNNLNANNNMDNDEDNSDDRK
ncbi:hypothetical protein DOY81_009363 [Sarcophaga bullata]|nr:hypothetical protein DOY81_009363 [Sarcophaga bullata]